MLLILWFYANVLEKMAIKDRWSWYCASLLKIKYSLQIIYLERIYYVFYENKQVQQFSDKLKTIVKSEANHFLQLFCFYLKYLKSKSGGITHNIYCKNFYSVQRHPKGFLSSCYSEICIYQHQINWCRYISTHANFPLKCNIIAAEKKYINAAPFVSKSALLLWLNSTFPTNRCKYNNT